MAVMPIAAAAVLAGESEIKNGNATIIRPMRTTCSRSCAQAVGAIFANPCKYALNRLANTTIGIVKMLI